MNNHLRDTCGKCKEREKEKEKEAKKKATKLPSKGDV